MRGRGVTLKTMSGPPSLAAPARNRRRATRVTCHACGHAGSERYPVILCECGRCYHEHDCGKRRKDYAVLMRSSGDADSAEKALKMTCCTVCAGICGCVGGQYQCMTNKSKHRMRKRRLHEGDTTTETVSLAGHGPSTPRLPGVVGENVGQKRKHPSAISGRPASERRVAAASDTLVAPDGAGGGGRKVMARSSRGKGLETDSRQQVQQTIQRSTPVVSGHEEQAGVRAHIRSRTHSGAVIFSPVPAHLSQSVGPAVDFTNTSSLHPMPESAHSISHGEINSSLPNAHNYYRHLHLLGHMKPDLEPGSQFSVGDIANDLIAEPTALLLLPQHSAGAGASAVEPGIAAAAAPPVLLPLYDPLVENDRPTVPTQQHLPARPSGRRVSQSAGQTTTSPPAPQVTE